MKQYLCMLAAFTVVLVAFSSINLCSGNNLVNISWGFGVVGTGDEGCEFSNSLLIHSLHVWA